MSDDKSCAGCEWEKYQTWLFDAHSSPVWNGLGGPCKKCARYCHNEDHYTPRPAATPEGPEPCPDCNGEGKVVIGEHLVTREMALDAGDPRLEGTHAQFEYGDCPACSGTGVKPEEEKDETNSPR